MFRRGSLLAVVLVLFAAPASAFDARSTSRHQHVAGGVRPRPFSSCAALVRYARHGLRVTRGARQRPVAPLSGGPVLGGSAPPAVPVAGSGPATTSSPSYSTTNDQEPGVDEPDIVKTNGSTIFVASGDAVDAVDVSTGTPRLVGTLRLTSIGYQPELLLQGNTLLVISSGGLPVPLAGGVGGGTGRGTGAPVRRWVAFPVYNGGQTVLTQVDVRDPGAMHLTSTMTVAGAFVDARQNGSTARIVISSTPYALAYPGAAGGARGWIPALRFDSIRTHHRYTRPVAACDAIMRPAIFSGLG